MATIETHRATLDGFFAARLLRSARSSLDAWMRARNTRKQLSRLSDHELDDIGLTRRDIYTRF